MVLVGEWCEYIIERNRICRRARCVALLTGKRLLRKVFRYCEKPECSSCNVKRVSCVLYLKITHLHKSLLSRAICSNFLNYMCVEHLNSICSCSSKKQKSHSYLWRRSSCVGGHQSEIEAPAGVNAILFSQWVLVGCQHRALRVVCVCCRIGNMCERESRVLYTYIERVQRAEAESGGSPVW